MDCFAYGFGIATASRLSHFLASKNSNVAIKTAYIAIFVSILMGLLFTCVLLTFNEKIARIFIKSDKTVEKLVNIQSLYAFLIPLELCQGAIYAIVRSINKNNWLIIAQIIANYFIHFAVLFLTLIHI